MSQQQQAPQLFRAEQPFRLGGARVRAGGTRIGKMAEVPMPGAQGPPVSSCHEGVLVGLGRVKAPQDPAVPL